MRRIRNDLDLAERHRLFLADQARADDWHRTYRP
jgi:hypothetical protein